MQSTQEGSEVAPTHTCSSLTPVYFSLHSPPPPTCIVSWWCSCFMSSISSKKAGSNALSSFLRSRFSDSSSATWSRSVCS